jgi:decaprenylphospho-beta-D-ribofuranose 2-oxidase
MGHELLAGWGRTAPTSADVRRPGDRAGAVADVAAAPARGVIARGLGRSYGDAAQNAGGMVISTLALSGIDWADETAGLVRVAGGASLGDVLAFLAPQGWALPVVPGTRHVTAGGAVAADVHGKNHPVDGSFARHVTELTLATPDGLRRVTADDDPDLFWATAGGLGLTGLVVEATLQAVAVETAGVRVVSRRAAGLDDLMAAMESEAGRHRYAVAWLDTMAGGRGVVSWGDHAAVTDLPRSRRATPVAAGAVRSRAVPGWWPGGPLPVAAVAALNQLRYRRSSATDTVAVEPRDRFLFPLDALDGWNRLLGRTGFVQHQFVVPFAAGGLVSLALDLLRRAACPPFLAVLKRLGGADPGPLSFPMPGWTLALDFQTARPGLSEVLDRLDELVAGAGGRVYLAKDGRLRPELLGVMYPGLDRWRAVQRRVDPDGVFASDLGRRLGLVSSTVKAG